MVEPYYKDDLVTIYNCDCRELLPSLPKVDLVLTDPPYGIGADRNLRANKQHGKAIAPSKDYGIGSWDASPPPDWMFNLIRERSLYQIIWGGNYFPLPPSPCWLVWDKQNGNNGYADCELAWTSLNKAVRKIDWRWMGMLQQNMRDKEYRHHPTQKPEAVMVWSINQAPDDCQSITDPYMGSGTTLKAAKLLGKQATGIEIEERYCEIAAKRCESIQAGLFDAPIVPMVREPQTGLFGE